MKLLALTFAAALASSPALATCHQGPIETFFDQFAAAIAVQEAVAATTISLSTIDFDADPEPKLVEKQIPAAELEWPLVPAKGPFLNSGGSIQFSKNPLNEDVVTLSGDSGYLMNLVFTAEPCWKLVAIIDESA